MGSIRPSSIIWISLALMISSLGYAEDATSSEFRGEVPTTSSADGIDPRGSLVAKWAWPEPVTLTDVQKLELETVISISPGIQGQTPEERLKAAGKFVGNFFAPTRYGVYFLATFSSDLNGQGGFRAPAPAYIQIARQKATFGTDQFSFEDVVSQFAWFFAGGKPVPHEGWYVDQFVNPGNPPQVPAGPLPNTPLYQNMEQTAQAQSSDGRSSFMWDLPGLADPWTGPLANTDVKLHFEFQTWIYSILPAAKPALGHLHWEFELEGNVGSDLSSATLKVKNVKVKDPWEDFPKDKDDVVWLLTHNPSYGGW